jgi:hypothetical protein
MLVERYLRKRYEAGKAEGLTKAWQVWQAWNQRRMDRIRKRGKHRRRSGRSRNASRKILKKKIRGAEKAGQPFNEPPPELNHSK